MLACVLILPRYIVPRLALTLTTLALILTIAGIALAFTKLVLPNPSVIKTSFAEPPVRNKLPVISAVPFAFVILPTISSSAEIALATVIPVVNALVPYGLDVRAVDPIVILLAVKPSSPAMTLILPQAKLPLPSVYGISTGLPPVILRLEIEPKLT